MKKIKIPKIKRKVLISIVVLILLCLIVFTIVKVVRHNHSSTPVGMVEEFFEKYKKLDSSVVKDITYDFSDRVNSEQTSTYIGIIKKQYEKIDYYIIDKYINENDATINVNVSVIDLRQEYEKATSYIEAHKDKFNNKKGEYDEIKAINYKIDEMSKASLKIDYFIAFKFYKDEKNQWVMEDVHGADELKLKGTY